MKALARTLATAAALAALSLLLAAAAHATPPQVDQRNVDRPHATQHRHGKVWRCNAGHGPQFDCHDAGSLTNRPSPGPAAATPAGRSGPLAMVRSVALLGLLAALAAGGTGCGATTGRAKRSSPLSATVCALPEPEGAAAPTGSPLSTSGDQQPDPRRPGQARRRPHPATTDFAGTPRAICGSRRNRCGRSR